MALAKTTRDAILEAEIMAIGADTDKTIPAHMLGSAKSQSQ
jgi:hypothetical protein